MNRTALVTGGSRGIGLGIARELAKSGYHIAVNGVRENKQVDSAMDELRSLGQRVSYIRGDLSISKDRQAIFDHVIREYGCLNVLVNNAGIAPPERRDLLETTEESYDRVMDVNLKAPYFFTQLFAKHMIEKKLADDKFSGCIINVSSISATVASINRGEYCISKAGVSMSTRLWAVKMGDYDIPVYEIQPGITKTDMTSAVKEKYDGLIAEGLCVQKRWGLPEDVGKVAAAMANGSLPYATGQVVVVDGGLTIPRL
ncbi:MAG: 3-ketoacyl-ACP reductase [Bacteroidales bacterium]|nr:3-ketoacyl-ACP reductase [Bacteroidales bacterium]